MRLLSSASVVVGTSDMKLAHHLRPPEVVAQHQPPGMGHHTEQPLFYRLDLRLCLLSRRFSFVHEAARGALCAGDPSLVMHRNQIAIKDMHIQPSVQSYPGICFSRTHRSPTLYTTWSGSYHLHLPIPNTAFTIVEGLEKKLSAHLPNLAFHIRDALSVIECDNEPTTTVVHDLKQVTALPPKPPVRRWVQKVSVSASC